MILPWRVKSSHLHVSTPTPWRVAAGSMNLIGRLVFLRWNKTWRFWRGLKAYRTRLSVVFGLSEIEDNLSWTYLFIITYTLNQTYKVINSSFFNQYQVDFQEKTIESTSLLNIKNHINNVLIAVPLDRLVNDPSYQWLADDEVVKAKTWRIASSSSVMMILLMEEILHQLIGTLSHHLQGFIHPRWLAGFLPSTVVPLGSINMAFWIFSPILNRKYIDSK